MGLYSPFLQFLRLLQTFKQAPRIVLSRKPSDPFLARFSIQRQSAGKLCLWRYPRPHGMKQPENQKAKGGTTQGNACLSRSVRKFVSR